MAFEKYFDFFVLEGLHSHIPFLSVRDSQYGWSIVGLIRIQSTESIGVVAGVQTVDESEISKVIDVDFHLQDDNNSMTKKKSQEKENELTCLFLV